MFPNPIFVLMFVKLMVVSQVLYNSFSSFSELSFVSLWVLLKFSPNFLFFIEHLFFFIFLFVILPISSFPKPLLTYTTSPILLRIPNLLSNLSLSYSYSLTSLYPVLLHPPSKKFLTYSLIFPIPKLQGFFNFFICTPYSHHLQPYEILIFNI